MLRSRAIESLLDEGQEKRREREALRHMWEFASIVQFFTIFGSYLRILPSFKIGCEMDSTSQEIEEAFLNQNDLMLAELHVKVLRSLLQREDITYNKEVDVRSLLWYDVLADVLKDHGGEYNPLVEKSYHQLSVVDKVRVLQFICDMLFTLNDDLVEYSRDDRFDPDTMRAECWGRDNAGSIYHYFGDYRLYREVLANSARGKAKAPPKPKKEAAPKKAPKRAAKPPVKRTVGTRRSGRVTANQDESEESDKSDNEEGSEKEDGDQPEKEEAEQPANEGEETKKAEEADEAASQHFLEPYEFEGQKYYWETCCVTSADWEALHKELKASRSRYDKELVSYMDEIIDKIVTRLQNQEREKERRMLFDAMPRRISSRVKHKEVLTAEEERMNFLKQEAERLRKVEEDKARKEKEAKVRAEQERKEREEAAAREREEEKRRQKEMEQERQRRIKEREERVRERELQAELEKIKEMELAREREERRLLRTMTEDERQQYLAAKALTSGSPKKSPKPKPRPREPMPGVRHSERAEKLKETASQPSPEPPAVEYTADGRVRRAVAVGAERKQSTDKAGRKASAPRPRKPKTPAAEAGGFTVDHEALPLPPITPAKKPDYYLVFSTSFANEAALAVRKGEAATVGEYHRRAQERAIHAPSRIKLVLKSKASEDQDHPVPKKRKSEGGAKADDGAKKPQVDGWPAPHTAPQPYANSQLDPGTRAVQEARQASVALIAQQLQHEAQQPRVSTNQHPIQSQPPAQHQQATSLSFSHQPMASQHGQQYTAMHMSQTPHQAPSHMPQMHRPPMPQQAYYHTQQPPSGLGHQPMTHMHHQSMPQHQPQQQFAMQARQAYPQSHPAQASGPHQPAPYYHQQQQPAFAPTSNFTLSQQPHAQTHVIPPAGVNGLGQNPASQGELGNASSRASLGSYTGHPMTAKVMPPQASSPPMTATTQADQMAVDLLFNLRTSPHSQ